MEAGKRAGGGSAAAARLGDAYISGALTAVGDGAAARHLYELLADVVAAEGYAAYLPHRHTDPIAAPDMAPPEVYAVDRRRIAEATVLVAYAGAPSFGVGTEVEIAREHGVPVILVAERDRAVSRILLGNPAVREVVRFGDAAELRTSLAQAVRRAEGARAAALPVPADDVVVDRFLRTLAEARQLPDAEVAALLRVAGIGDPALVEGVWAAIRDGRLFAAGLRDLVGRHRLRGEEFAALLSRYVLGRSAPRRTLHATLARLGLAPDDAAVAQWLVTELITPPPRALQLRLFGAGGED